MESRFLRHLDAIESEVRHGSVPDRAFMVDGRTLDLGAYLREARDDARDRVEAIEAAIAALRRPAATTGAKSRDPHRPLVQPGRVARIGDHPKSSAIFVAVVATAVRRAEALPERVEIEGETVGLAEALALLTKETRSPAGEAARMLWLDESASVGAVAAALLEKLTADGVLAKPRPVNAQAALNAYEAQQHAR